MWGGLALLSLVALGSSVFLSGAAVTASERDAADRAEGLTASIVASELTRELVLQDITGEDYRRLLVAVQAGILSDDQVVTVRVWRTDGNLLFSTAQRDEPAEVIASDDPQIQAAAGGEVTSVLSTEIEPRVGLRRPNEELLQTYVPVSLVTESFVDAVVEVDQRYGAIRNDALTLWRPVQILLAAGLVLIVGALVRSLRAKRPAEDTAAGPSPTVTYSRADDRVVREAKERVQAAERRAKEAEEKLRERDERGTAAANDSGVAEELDLKIRAAEAEREQHMGEIQRLRAALAGKEADLALARDGNGNTRAEAKKTNKLIAEADGRASEAEQKAAAAERRATEAAQRAVDASGRALEMEAQIRALEEKFAEGAPDAASMKRKGAGERKAESELKRSTDELVKAKAESVATLAELEAAKVKLGTTASELGSVRSELGSAQSELGTTKDRLAEMEAERDAFRARVAGLEVTLAEAEAAALASAASREVSSPIDGNVPALEERAIDAERRLVGSEERSARAQAQLAESDARLADALARLEELEQARSTVEGDAGAEHDLAARIAELEKARRADIQELHRVQEAFANTQVEFTNTTKKLRESERRIRELEGDAGVRRHGAPTYAPSGERGTPPEPEPTQPVKEERPLEPVGVDSFEDRVSSLRAGLAAANDLSWDLDRETAGDQLPDQGLPPMPPVPDVGGLEPEVPEPDPELDLEAEGLSLRERLARAAAARHRGPLA